MSTFGTQHARQEIERPSERARTFSPSFIALTVIVVLVLLVALLYTPIKLAFARAEATAQAIELKQLELAISYYVEKVGEPPPSTVTMAEIENHFRTAKYRRGMATLNLDNFAHDVANLDDRETLVFWLSGEAWQSVFAVPHRDAYYEFPPTRLTDVDHDGWPEYTYRNGNFFILRNGKVLVYDPSTKTEYSLEDLENTVQDSEN